MPSALITARLGYPALPLAEQLEHHRSVLPGPLVLGKGSLKPPAPTADRDRRETICLIGRMCKEGNLLSKPVLTGREA